MQLIFMVFHRSSLLGQGCGHACRGATTGAGLDVVFRAVHRYTARVDPRHQGGEGVAGTPGACSQAFCHPNQLHPLCGMDRHVTKTQGPHHNHHNHHTRLNQVAQFLWCPFCRAFKWGTSWLMLHTLRVPPRGGESDGSAPCFGMSAGASRWPWPSSRTTPHEDRGRPGRGRRCGERDARRPTGTEDSPGERPGCLSDPGPQRSDRTVRHSAGKLLHCCRRRWPVRRPMLWTTPRWPSSLSVAQPEEERGGGGGGGGEESGDGAGSGGEGAVACAAEGV